MALKADSIAYPPRGMSREEAARYVGVSPAKFDEMIARKMMPKPRQMDRRTIWDRVELDTSFSDLPHQEHKNVFDRAFGRDTSAHSGTGGEGTGDRHRHAGRDAEGR